MASPQIENGYTKISNELMDALNRIRISGEAHQVLGAIIRKTYGFNKKQDQIATSQFMELTGLPNFAIHKARKKLLKMNMITITKKGDSQILNYVIQKDYHKWIPLPKKVTLTKKGNDYNQKRLQVSPKKVTNYNQKSGIQKKERQLTKDTITKDIPTIEIRDYFYSSHKHCFNKDYIPHYGKDGAIFKRLLAVITLEELKGLVNKFFASQDKFVQEAGFTVGVFESQINKLRQPTQPFLTKAQRYGVDSMKHLEEKLAKESDECSNI